VTLDAPSIATALSERNYAVTDGTLGRPFVVEKAAGFVHVPSQVDAPGLTEADMVIADLQGPDAVDERPLDDLPAPGVKSIWSSMKHGVIDPRPSGMLMVRDLLDRMHAHGGVLIVLTAPQFDEPYVVAEIERRVSSRTDLGQTSDLPVDNWSLSNALKTFGVSADVGREITPTELATSIGLGRSMWSGSFTCTVEPGYSERDRWVPLARNMYDKDVAGILPPSEDTSEGWILLLPRLDRVEEVVLELVETLLPTLAPQIFALGDKSAWTETADYEHHDVRVLREEIDRIRQQAEVDVLAVEARVEAARQAQAHLHTLLTGTGDDLVNAVIKTLMALGFPDVVNIDAEKAATGDAGLKREDIHISLDGYPLILGEVKGIEGLPKEVNALQVTKYLAPRMRELQRTDLRGLSIVNHQRHLPPLQRNHHNVFQQDVLVNAEEQGITLMTGWELFRLARNAARCGWPFEAVRPLFYADGRPDVVPTHYRPLGKIEEVWRKAEAFAITLTHALGAGSMIAIEGPVDVAEFTADSIRLEDQDVRAGAAGSKIGIKAPGAADFAKTGMRVFYVEQHGSERRADSLVQD